LVASYNSHTEGSIDCQPLVLADVASVEDAVTKESGSMTSLHVRGETEIMDVAHVGIVGSPAHRKALAEATGPEPSAHGRGYDSWCSRRGKIPLLLIGWRFLCPGLGGAPPACSPGGQRHPISDKGNNGLLLSSGTTLLVGAPGRCSGRWAQL
jgi:hypothetical protein